MEQPQNLVENIIAPLKKVTPVSKYLAMGLFIVLPFIGGWVGYRFASQQSFMKERVYQSEDWGSDANQENIKYKASEGGSSDIEVEYGNSTYRVVSVARNPFDSDYDSLVIATPRGDNDYTCGGPFSPDKCYLFLESSTADIVTPKFLRVWDEGAIEIASIRFVATSTISFDTAFGDAGGGRRETWEISLESGSSTRTYFIEHFPEPE